MADNEKKRLISPRTAHFLFIAIGFLTILWPLAIHFHGVYCGWYCFGLIHNEWFFPLVSNRHFDELNYDKFQIWEFFSVVQAIGVSILLMAEPEGKYVNQIFMFLYFILLLICLAALFLLGWEHADVFRWVILVVLAIFWFGDWFMWSQVRKDTPNYDPKSNVYKLVVFYVDLPILFSMLLLTTYVTMKPTGDFSAFYSGAVAFQIILANLLIFLIRSHERLQQDRDFLGTLWNVIKPPPKERR